MAIVYARRLINSRSLDGKADGKSFSETYVVRTDSAAQSLTSIVNATGVTLNSVHAEDPTAQAQSYSVKTADDGGLLYHVTWDYEKPKEPQGSEGSGSGSEGDEQPGQRGTRLPFWSASSTVTSGPVFKDVNDVVITNSAGDPLEGLEKEYAEFRLSLTQYYDTHDQAPAQPAGMQSWSDAAKFFTNRTNSATWNGGAVDTWKCQGCSAKLNFDDDGNYWEVTWEFAYRSDGWQLKPWDVGFHELVDDYGDPNERDEGWQGAGSGEEGGNGCPNDARRKAILGQDGKPVKQPVALSNGVAKPPCQPPDALTWNVYLRAAFANQFGELNTP